MHSVTLLWKSMNTVSLIIGLTYIVQLLEGCNQNLNPVVVNEADTASFQYNPVSTSGSETYEVKRTGESAKVRLAYTSGSPDAVQTNVRVTFTGSETAGEISFNLGDVEKIDNGTYALKNAAGNELQCIILYIKGVVTVTLSATKNPVEQGEQVNFTCKAESQTVPLVSSYDFSWTFKTDSLTGSSNPRHTLNGQNFLIDDVRTTDSGKYTCTATEDIPNGGTASAEFYLEVNGPGPCDLVLCYVLIILSCCLIVPAFIGIHFCLIHNGHKFAVKELIVKDYGIKAFLPGCCICFVKITIQLITYFLPFKECSFVTCLVVPIIGMVLVNGVGVAVIGGIVHFKKNPDKNGQSAGNEEMKLQKNNTAGSKIGNSDTTGNDTQ